MESLSYHFKGYVNVFFQVIGSNRWFIIQGDPVEIARVTKESVKEDLKRCLEGAQSYIHGASTTKLALVIDGKCLMYALDPTLRVDLLNLSLNCNSVICCRVSPLQKAQVQFQWDYKVLYYYIILIYATFLFTFYLSCEKVPCNDLAE